MVKTLTTWLSCSTCRVRFEVEVVWDYSVHGYPSAELLEQMRAFVLEMAKCRAWEIDGDRHVCPGCR